MKTLYPPEVEGTSDFKHLLNGAGLDAIVIATRREKPIMRSPKPRSLAGKHVFVGKAAGQHSVAESQELTSIAAQKRTWF